MKNLMFTFVFFLLLAPVELLSEELNLLPTSLPIPKENVPKKIEVALAVNASQVIVSTEGSFELLNPNNSDVFLKGLGNFQAQVLPKPNGISVNGQLYSTTRLLLKTEEGLVEVGKRKYRDQIRISKMPNNSLTVTNRLDLEEYLKGVLPLEVHPKWHMEALKAQAIISRTFALFKSIEKQNQQFSVKDTVESQVYGGALFHAATTDQAINETRGQILTFQGNIFPTYFHSTCGGQTTRPDRIWPVKFNAVFKSIPCSFCKESKQWKWSFAMPLSEIEKIMQKKGYPAKNLKQISFTDRDATGRISKVILEYERSSLTIKAADFRAFLGNSRLRGLKAWVVTKEKKAFFRGFGWGHGVGFCQWGAKGMADQSKSYQEILKFYFPDAELTQL